MKKIVMTSLLLVSLFALFTSLSHNAVVAAGKVAVINATEKPEIPKFNATAYIAGHGGHLAIVDMRTMKAPVDVMDERIVLVEAGSEMEGTIAGMTMEEVKKSGGSHGQALVMEKGRKVLVASTLAGDVFKIDLKTGKRKGPFKVGQKFCGTIVGPDGKIYLEDMADGHVYVWDSKKMKTVDKMPVGKAVCGIQWTKNSKKAYISDMPTGIVYVYNWKTKKEIKQIKSPEMTFIHQIRMTPDGKELWVSAPNEFGPGLSEKSRDSQVVIIDTKKDEIVKRIVMPRDINPHDFAFSKDGKYAFLSSRVYEEDDSELNIMKMSDYNIVGTISVCAACHKEVGVEVKIDDGVPLLCGIELDWHK
jgi:WD40 repeat protein